MLTALTKVLFGVSIIASLLSLAFNFINNMAIYNANWYVSVIFYLLVSILINTILFRKKVDPKEFVLKIMLTSMLRLVIYMFGIFIYRLIDKSGFTSFVVHFMTHYILFTVIEIAYLLRYSKTQKS